MHIMLHISSTQVVEVMVCIPSQKSSTHVGQQDISGHVRGCPGGPGLPRRHTINCWHGRNCVRASCWNRPKLISSNCCTIKAPQLLPTGSGIQMAVRSMRSEVARVARQDGEILKVQCQLRVQKMLLKFQAGGKTAPCAFRRRRSRSAGRSQPSEQRASRSQTRICQRMQTRARQKRHPRKSRAPCVHCTHP